MTMESKTNFRIAFCDAKHGFPFFSSAALHNFLMLHRLRKRSHLSPLWIAFTSNFPCCCLDHPSHLKVHATKNVGSWRSCGESQFKDLRTCCCFRNYASQMYCRVDMEMQRWICLFLSTKSEVINKFVFWI